MAQIEATGGVENARQLLAEAMQAATDLAENLRYSHQALRQGERGRRDPRDPS
jgi:hypothetical protein